MEQLCAPAQVRGRNRRRFWFPSPVAMRLPNPDVTTEALGWGPAIFRRILSRVSRAVGAPRLALLRRRRHVAPPLPARPRHGQLAVAALLDSSGRPRRGGGPPADLPCASSRPFRRCASESSSSGLSQCAASPGRAEDKRTSWRYFSSRFLPSDSHPFVCALVLHSAASGFARGLQAPSPPDLAALLSPGELDEIAGRDGRFSGIPAKDIVTGALQRELTSVRLP